MTRKSQKYFSNNELKCTNTGVVKLDPRFDEALFDYREALQHPLYVNSCCRSVAYNSEIGGSKNSYHLYHGVMDGREGTLAIDLRVQSDGQRANMVSIALMLGWSVGVYRTFIHIDLRTALGKEQVCFWGKY